MATEEIMVDLNDRDMQRLNDRKPLILVTKLGNIHLEWREE